ncbi:MAG: hypothetical protein ACT4PL_02660, partial [Phycisphaerales bacterium]
MRCPAVPAAVALLAGVAAGAHLAAPIGPIKAGAVAALIVAALAPRRRPAVVVAAAMAGYLLVGIVAGGRGNARAVAPPRQARVVAA